MNNRKAFALGLTTAIATLGAFAAAFSIPNAFSGGEVISATKMNANFEALGSAVTALEANGSVSTARLADNAVTAAKIADEPGAGQDVNAGSIALDGTLQTIQEVTITAPAAGFALVVASTEVDLNHTTATATTVKIGVTNGAAFAGDQDKDVEIPANAPTGNYKQVVASQKIFPVTAGSNTFRLLADEGTGAVVLDERTLSVVFIPTSYGTVE